MAEPKEPVSVARLSQLLRYEPRTGELFWRVHRGSKCKPGDPAGNTRSDGYREVMIDGQHCRTHRVAWAITYGEWPQWPVDHIDVNRANNAISNLREITPTGNSHNVHVPHAQNKTGFLGVWRMASGKFRAEIRAAGVRHKVGIFETAEAAHEAYLEKKRELHPMAFGM